MLTTKKRALQCFSGFPETKRARTDLPEQQFPVFQTYATALQEYQDPLSRLKKLCKAKKKDSTLEQVKTLVEEVGSSHLLERENERRSQMLLSHHDPFSCSPLLEAADFGHVKIVDFLLQNGWNLDIRTSRGCHALHLAAYRGHLPVCRLLCERYNVNPDIKMADPHSLIGQSAPLILAARNGHLHIVKYFQTIGADMLIQDQTCSNALHRAVGWGQAPVVEYLLANTELKYEDALNTRGLSYIHAAAYYRRHDVLEILYKNGMDLDLLSPLGTSAHIAQVFHSAHCLTKNDQLKRA